MSPLGKSRIGWVAGNGNLDIGMGYGKKGGNEGSNFAPILLSDSLPRLIAQRGHQTVPIAKYAVPATGYRSPIGSDNWAPTVGDRKYPI